ncbi:hypothetical protein HYH03_017952 [Edaphochlamys debaryana]|uniref:NIF system FeS cluster assembly NifU C-terminal domain-containing protein n=1 Tax=Edaphochlamys debaryana TaxID=47281 RepID=A0A836BNL9_9CHLO|nr:hypothetical protein HYH03_017952 [Edaphochlamys debaryana]|eukprot:KAG2483160.1 hypothetical protein HYH03_017952 [Edaphochlamys debaryana]
MKTISSSCQRQAAPLGSAPRARAFPLLRAVAPATNPPPGPSISPFAAPITDANVPEGHQGLHGFLYGSGGAEEHADQGYAVRENEDEGAAVMPVAAYLASRDGERPLGVYCCYDEAGAAQYIGYSRNMVLAIKSHLARVGPERCASVRAMVFRNKAMASRANLERQVAAWVDERLGGALPPGNSSAAQRTEWEGAQPEDSTDGEAGAGGVAAPPLLDRSLMSPAELAAYEEKRLKMRKAMGEKMVEGPGAKAAAPGSDAALMGSHDSDEEEDPAVRRAKLMKAMNAGDWSVVIDQQTREALGIKAEAGAEGAPAEAGAAPAEGAPAAAPSSAPGPLVSADGVVVSPFQAGGAAGPKEGGARGKGGRAPPALTVAAVQQALEEVRPYLLADGGDVEVVDVTDGVVYLRLQGACSSCPSQSATMKGGIEKLIHSTFGDQVKDILQLDKLDPSASKERVDAALDMLRGAISGLGGSVQVVSVEDGIANIRYKGPPAIGKGVAGAIKDSFRDLKEVRLVD